MTGATGKIGSSFVKDMAAAGSDIRAHCRWGDSGRDRRIHWVEGDLRQPAICDRLLHEQDVLVHLAWQGSPLAASSSLVETAETDLVTTLHLLDAARRARRRLHVVFVSSGGAVYGATLERRPFRETDLCVPTSSYGVQKLAVEGYIRSLVLEGLVSATVLRVSTAYGWLVAPTAAQGFVGIALGAALAGRSVRLIGDPDNVRDYVFVDDICSALRLACDRIGRNETFNIGSGHGVSVTEVVAIISEMLGRDIPTYQEDWPSGRLLPNWSVLDIAEAARSLQWSPRTALRAGLSRLLDRAQAEGAHRAGTFGRPGR